MSKKQISIFLLAIILLVGGIFLVAKRISDKNQGANPALNQLTSEQQKARVDMLSRRVPDGVATDPLIKN